MTWPIFKGNTEPHDGIDNLPEPAPWRKFAGTPPAQPRQLQDNARDQARGQAFQADDADVQMINAALFLRRPLLITGKPGSGKSSLAYAIAYELKLGPVLRWPITTRTTLKQGLYSYDAIGRMQEAQLLEEEPDIGRFICLGPLGTAMLPTQRPRVLLIDEIDKSDIDLPNDLLNIFEEGEFEIEELARLADRQSNRQEAVQVRPCDYDSNNPHDKVTIQHGKVICRAFPVVVMTSNAEREFPAPFLRRCIRLDMQPPNEDKLARIVAQHLDDPVAKQANALIGDLELRANSGDETAIHMLATLPGTVVATVELRIRAAHILGKVGDPRPGVCTLPPLMAHIEGGTFIIGTKKEEKGRHLENQGFDYLNREINDKPVMVSTFELARYPVTNAQYKFFMEDDGYNPDKPWWDDAGREWLKDEKKHQPEDWDDKRFGITRPNHPVVGVTWYEVMAFCRWLTQHREYNPEGYVYTLPTEAEWEYAARGPQRRMYPWGHEQPDGERANFKHTHKTTPVGCFPRGTTPDTGLDDMAGNVWEWTRSIYKRYPYNANDGREDLTNPSEQGFCIRGGGWSYPSVFLRASYRYGNTPDVCRSDSGFRLARHLP